MDSQNICCIEKQLFFNVFKQQVCQIIPQSIIYNLVKKTDLFCTTKY